MAHFCAHNAEVGSGRLEAWRKSEEELWEEVGGGGRIGEQIKEV